MLPLTNVVVFKSVF